MKASTASSRSRNEMNRLVRGSTSFKFVDASTICFSVGSALLFLQTDSAGTMPPRTVWRFAMATKIPAWLLIHSDNFSGRNRWCINFKRLYTFPNFQDVWWRTPKLMYKYHRRWLSRQRPYGFVTYMVDENDFALRLLTIHFAIVIILVKYALVDYSAFIGRCFIKCRYCVTCFAEDMLNDSITCDSNTSHIKGIGSRCPWYRAFKRRVFRNYVPHLNP